MGFREVMNQNRNAVTGVAIGVTVLAIGFLLYQSFGSGGAPSASRPTEYYFSTDDGATYFADDMKKVPPFDSGGKPAVLAHVFTCDGGRTKYVGYLERFAPATKKQMETMIAAGKTDPMELGSVSFAGSQVKRPKQPQWVPQASPTASAIMDAPCPGGGGIENMEPVFP